MATTLKSQNYKITQKIFEVSQGNFYYRYLQMIINNNIYNYRNESWLLLIINWLLLTDCESIKPHEMFAGLWVGRN